MAFQGSLVELPLTDVLQLVAVSNKSGLLTLRHGEARGEIHLHSGQIVHAVAGSLSGDQAFFELARWLAGEFDFTQGAPVAIRTIETSNTTLLLEAARQIDEWKLLARRIGSTRMVLVFAPSNASRISLSPREWAVVSRVDERRNIEEVAAALGESTFETCKVIHGLLTSGVLALREDLRLLPIDRIRNLSANDLDLLAREIHRFAAEPLEGLSRSPELEGALRLYQAEHQSGRTFDALLDLVREAEKAVSAALGPNQARSFLDRVAARLGASADRAAAGPVAPAPAAPLPASPARAPRPPVDLGRVRNRLSELAYQGLGPEGELHVLRIEKARRADELLQVGSAARDLLHRIGKEEVARAIEAELEKLA